MGGCLSLPKGTKVEKSTLTPHPLHHTTIFELPVELIVKIFKHLSGEDIHGSCSQVCQRFLDIVRHHFHDVELDLGPHSNCLETLQKSLTKNPRGITRLKISIHDGNLWQQHQLDRIWSVIKLCRPTLRSFSLLIDHIFDELSESFVEALGTLTNLEELSLEWVLPGAAGLLLFLHGFGWYFIFLVPPGAHYGPLTGLPLPRGTVISSPSELEVCIHL